MKKLLALVLLLCLLLPCAAADDMKLSGFTYDELIALRNAVNAEIVSRPEWKSVEVPIGCWRVGIDVPAGFYSIEIKDPNRLVSVSVWGYAAQDYTTNGGLIHNLIIGQKQGSIGKIELKDGYILDVNYPVILKPAQGLSF